MSETETKTEPTAFHPEIFEDQLEAEIDNFRQRYRLRTIEAILDVIGVPKAIPSMIIFGTPQPLEAEERVKLLTLAFLDFMKDYAEQMPQYSDVKYDWKSQFEALALKKEEKMDVDKVREVLKRKHEEEEKRRAMENIDRHLDNLKAVEPVENAPVPDLTKVHNV